MRTSIRHYCRGTGIVAGLLLSSAALAGGPADDDPLLALQADVAEEELSDARGREDVFNAQIGEVTETASVTGVAVGNMTGSNVISDAAMSGLTGFSTVIQNTGNNVVIQDALVLNVQINQ